MNRRELIWGAGMLSSLMAGAILPLRFAQASIYPRSELRPMWKYSQRAWKASKDIFDYRDRLVAYYGPFPWTFVGTEFDIKPIGFIEVKVLGIDKDTFEALHPEYPTPENCLIAKANGGVFKWDRWTEEERKARLFV